MRDEPPETFLHHDEPATHKMESHENEISKPKIVNDYLVDKDFVGGESSPERTEHSHLDLNNLSVSVETSPNTLLKLFSVLHCSFNSGLVWINEDDRLSSESISYENY